MFLPWFCSRRFSRRISAMPATVRIVGFKFGFTIQPSEFAKLALIIMLAWYCDRSQRQMNTWNRGMVLPGLIIASVLGLIFIEPDRGTTILLAAVAARCCSRPASGGRTCSSLPWPARRAWRFPFCMTQCA